jgi:hypothetical protein
VREIAVVGREQSDEPFPFASFAALASACRHRGDVAVLAAHLPYGVWWDLLRPTVELRRDGDPPDDPLPLDGVWEGPDRFVSLHDGGYDEVVAPYRCGLDRWLVGPD